MKRCFCRFSHEAPQRVARYAEGEHSISRLLHVFAPPFVAAFLPFLACNFFASPLLHGIFSAEVFFVLIALLLPARQILYKLPFILVVVIYGFWQGTDDAYAYALAITVLVLSSAFIPRKRLPLTIFYGFFVLAIFVFDCDNFFYFTFSFHVRNLWSLALFFGWGIVLFFAVPALHVAFVLFFSRNCLYGTNRVTLSHKNAFILVILLLLANEGINQLQSRQPIMDFPVKRTFFYNIFIRPCDKVSILDEKMKRSFEIWNDSIDPVSDYHRTTVMILVESWGVSKSVEFNRALLDVYKANNQIFSGLKSRNTSYTQGAEWEDFGMPDGHRDSADLIAAKFKQSGLQSYYVHGYDGEFYSREKSYPDLDFDSLYFKKEFEQKGLTQCRYSFSGICDSSIVKFLDSLLTDSVPKFVFWTTLDAHAPYDFNEKIVRSPTCDALRMNEMECTFFTLQENTAKSIADLAQKHPDVRFVVRGDHRPPCLIPLRDRKFVETFYHKWVSMVVLN